MLFELKHAKKNQRFCCFRICIKIPDMRTMENCVRYILFSAVVSFCFSCAPSAIRKKNITFDAQHELKLDVYSPKKVETARPVFVFIHGGGWNSGKKSQYKFLGRRMASKGVVTVVPDYRLSPRTEYRGATTDVAMALKWIKENISEYRGDSSRIFIAGHSAGGHLAALVSVDNFYFDSLKVSNPVSGTILIDAFGLDMFSYLSNESLKKNRTYYAMFGQHPDGWKDGSPVFHLNENMKPFLMFVGTKTYPVIYESNKEFFEALKRYHPETKPLIEMKKKHIPMMLQFYNSKNRGYEEILGFLIRSERK
jgi:acetyl esterase/lipase